SRPAVTPSCSPPAAGTPSSTAPSSPRRRTSNRRRGRRSRSPRAGGPVQRLVHQPGDQGLLEGLPQDEQPVVAGTPELVDDHLQVRVRAQAAALLGGAQPPPGQLAPRTGVPLRPRPG